MCAYIYKHIYVSIHISGPAFLFRQLSKMLFLWKKRKKMKEPKDKNKNKKPQKQKKTKKQIWSDDYRICPYQSPRDKGEAGFKIWSTGAK